jgi:DNA-binding MarR family transcriptional regulator
MDDDTPERPAEVDSPGLASATSLREPLMALARRMRRQRPDHQLPLTQVQVLADLARGGPLTPVELAAHERVRPQSLTPAVNALEADGLVTKRPDPTDGRRQLLELTAAGDALVTADRAQRDAWLAAAMAAELTPLERDLLHLVAPLLRRLADAEPVAARER